MSRLSGFGAALGVVGALAVAGVTPAFSAAIGTGAGQMANVSAPVTQVGCWNCNNGAAVGVGIAAGIIGGAAIASALAPPPPVVYAPAPVYVAPPPPPPYVAPAPVYYPPPGYYPPPPAYPRPGRCWFQSDAYGNGYWGRC